MVLLVKLFQHVFVEIIIKQTCTSIYIIILNYVDHKNWVYMVSKL